MSSECSLTKQKRDREKLGASVRVVRLKPMKYGGNLFENVAAKDLS